MAKIVVIAHSPLTYKHIGTLGLDKLSELTNVCYWDVSPMIGNETRLPESLLKKVSIEVVEDMNHFRDLIKDLDEKTLVIFYINISFSTLSLYELVSNTKCKMSTIITGCLPPVSKDLVSGEKLLSKIKKANVEKIIEISKRILVERKLRKIRSFDYCLCSGEAASLLNVVGMSNLTQRLQFNSYDYQLARDSKQIKYVEGNYILFIDNYFPFHPDIEIIGFNSINADLYYNELNAYFDLIERKLGMPIVVAPHPKAEKYHSQNYFNGRRIIWGDTNSLVYHSSLVVAHYSTAISYAVIYRKPILFIYTNNMWETDPYCSIVKNMACVLNCNCVNISNEKNLDVFDVDEIKYEEYLYKYITSPSSQCRDNYQIILELLQLIQK